MDVPEALRVDPATAPSGNVVKSEAESERKRKVRETESGAAQDSSEQEHKSGGRHVKREHS